MENAEENRRLEVKTKPEAVRRQARWCGVKPGLRVLDAGCGPGKTTFILYDMIQPGGEILGIDYAKSRIEHARRQYAGISGMEFRVHDIRDSMENFGTFDLIWVRFVLEYNAAESRDIVNNLAERLNPGGHLCLMDLDQNCLNHYPLPEKIQEILSAYMGSLQRDHNFDPYAGRKLYAYLYDAGFEDIRMDLSAHHLLYGSVSDADVFNWVKKVEVTSGRLADLLVDYPGGTEGFREDFRRFFLDPRRFTYTPLIVCMGKRPAVSARPLRARAMPVGP